MARLLDTLQGAIDAVWTRAHKISAGPPRDPVVAAWFGAGSDTASGIAVTPDLALRQVAVYACVRVLAETMAALPLTIYKRTADGGKEEDRGHPLWPILHDVPNEDQTSFEWREMSMGHLALRGNAYSRNVQNNAGATTALVPLHPDRVRPFRVPQTRAIAFDYTPPDGPREIRLPGEVLQTPGLGFDGLKGLSPITLHRETVGSALAAQEYGARFYKNDARPNGLLKHPGHFRTDEELAAFKKAWSDAHTGTNRHKTAILQEGMEYQALGMSNEDAQFIETRKFNVTDIARIFRVPPVKIGDLDRAIFKNFEQQNTSFVVDTILPWVTRWEQRLNATLLTEAGRRTHRIGFRLQGLLRGDHKTRFEGYATARQWGWMSANDVRRLEDQNPITGGDEYLVPLNMAPAGKTLDVLLRDAPSDSARAVIWEMIRSAATANPAALLNGHDRDEESEGMTQ